MTFPNVCWRTKLVQLKPGPKSLYFGNCQTWCLFYNSYTTLSSFNFQKLTTHNAKIIIWMGIVMNAPLRFQRCYAYRFPFILYFTRSNLRFLTVVSARCLIPCIRVVSDPLKLNLWHSVDSRMHCQKVFLASNLIILFSLQVENLILFPLIDLHFGEKAR